MKALIRKSFRHGARELIADSVEEIPDAAFAELKRERLVTEAPAERPAEVVEAAPLPIFPAEPIAAPVAAP